MAILVTGGAGYIGSVTVDRLRQKGEEVVVLDDLQRGHRASLDLDVPVYRGAAGDQALLARISAEHRLESCIHFAALAYVGESVEQPARYFRKNVADTIGLLDGLLAAGVRRLVLSSSCATYGEPQRNPIDETHRQSPTNPYGWSKLMVERILAAYAPAYGLEFVALRYFNAAGATERRGEHHDPETHLIPLALQVASGRRPFLSVFGNDYPTPDGTAVRDYVHVADLAEAHVLASTHLRAGKGSDMINLGTGRGASVLEVAQAAARVTGREVALRHEPRRTGDPAHLVASAERAGTVLGWRPRHVELDEIVGSAWRWQSANPHGYRE
jgi:UDP-glucose 4-epimerase